MLGTKLLLVDDNGAIFSISLVEMLASEFLIVGRLSSGRLWRRTKRRILSV